MLSDLGRLIILILLLPVLLILIGPMLVLAVFRGRQPLGPILFDTTHYRAAAKVITFILGIALWGGVWGGLVWLSGQAIAPVLPVVSPPDTPAAVTILMTNTPTPVLPAATATPVPSPSPPPVADTATPIPVTVLPPSATPPGTPTSAAASSTPTPTPTPVSTATSAPSQIPTVSPQSTLTYQERQHVEDVVKEANRLLQAAITEANDETLANLETVWQGLALNVAQAFAANIYEKYAKPVQVQFSYVRQPAVDAQSTYEEALVTSREKWTYGRTTNAEEETFEFVYTLTRADGAWVISRYTYRNLPETESLP